MAIPKGFENKDSKSEKTDGHKQSDSPTFDVLSLLGMPSAKDIEKGVKAAIDTAGHAVDGLKHLVSQAEQKPQADNEIKRGSLLNAPHQDAHKHGVLLGRLTHNETAAHQNPSHLSAFLLKRLHERQADNQHAEKPIQFDQQPIAFDQQQPQEIRGTQWQEANYSFRQATADVVLQAAKPLASLAPGADLNPNLGADEQRLKDMGLPFTRSVDKDMRSFSEHVLRPIAMRQPEKFHSQMSGESHATNLPYGGFQNYSHMPHNNYYHAENNYHGQNQHLPYGGFQSHVPYYRRQS